jgi:hypothetical protein
MNRTPGHRGKPPSISRLPALAAAPLIAAILSLSACHPLAQSGAQAAGTPPIARVYTQFSAGDPLDAVQTQLGLNNYEVRYRSGMAGDEMGMVYFLDDGNLHIDARKVGGAWIILSPPLLDPSDVSAADRVAEWDRGADSQAIKGKSDH